MRQSRQVRKSSSFAIAASANRWAIFMLVMVPVLLAAASAFADPGGSTLNLTKYATTATNKTNVIVDIINYISFLSGCVLAGLGISELRRLADGTGGGGLALRHPLTKLGFGGMLLAVPYMTSVLQGTMGSSGSVFDIFLMGDYKVKGAGAGGTGVGALIKNGINNTMILVDVANVAAYIIGVFFTVRGIQLLRAHIDNPGNAPLAESLKRLGVGGALFSFPILVNVVYGTFGATGDAISNSGWSSKAGKAGSLDGMITSFVSDIAGPAFQGIELFSYIAGIIMVLFALQRLVRTAQDGPRGPLSFGTITMFVVAGCLLSLPQFLAMLDSSLLGLAGQAKTQVSFMSTVGVDADQIQNAKNVFSAVLAFMAVIGFLSVVRGLFLLKAFADGSQQASMMSVATHLIAGSLAINLGGFINAVQTSLGISSLPVTFS